MEAARIQVTQVLLPTLGSETAERWNSAQVKGIRLSAKGAEPNLVVFAGASGGRPRHGVSSAVNPGWVALSVSVISLD